MSIVRAAPPVPAEKIEDTGPQTDEVLCSSLFFLMCHDIQLYILHLKQWVACTGKQGVGVDHKSPCTIGELSAATNTAKRDGCFNLAKVISVAAE